MGRKAGGGGTPEEVGKIGEIAKSDN